MTIEDGHQISIVVMTAHGPRKLHSFAYDARSATWWPWNPPSRKQMSAYRSQARELTVAIDGVDGMRDKPAEPRRTAGLGSNAASLKNWRGAVDLARGISVQPGVLELILNALGGDRRPCVTIDDINAIVSQQGSRINALAALHGPKRQHAEELLCKEILQRCTTI